MSPGDETDGCGVIVVGILVIAATVAGVISLTALIDPFSWMPPVGEIWADCSEDYGTEKDECALANRFHGFWLHAVINLGWTVVSAGLVVALLGAVANHRDASAARFDSAEAVARCLASRSALTGLAVAVGVAAALPVAAAVL